MKVKYNPQTNSFESSTEDSLLPHVMWHITDRCDLNCKTCFDKGRSKCKHNLSLGQIDSTLSMLKRFGVQKIDISGGEPLLYEKLPSLVNSAQTMGFFLTITTRGIGTKENKEWICKNWQKFTRIIISLDGGNSQICDDYSNYPGTFNQTTQFCNELKSKGCNIVRINTVVNKCILDIQQKKDLVDTLQLIAPLEWCLIEPHPANKLPTFDFYAVTSDEFNLFADDISAMFAQPLTSILLRRNSMYSTYWAVYTDNTISRLSESDNYSFTAELHEDNVQLISDVLAKVDHFIP